MCPLREIKIGKISEFSNFWSKSHSTMYQVNLINFWVIWIFFLHLALDIAEKLRINPNLHHHLCKHTKQIKKLKILVFLNQNMVFLAKIGFL